MNSPAENFKRIGNCKMIYRRFGKTGIKMPVFSCGGMRFQKSWKDLSWSEIDLADQENLEKIVEQCLALGINHFETSREYGSSELQLGKVLPLLDRKKIIVQTKLCPLNDTRRFESRLQRSFECLGLDYIDLFAIHGINTIRMLNDVLHNGCLDIVKKWKKKGFIHHIGFSTHAENEVIIKAIDSGQFSFVNLMYYYFDTENRKAISHAAGKNCGVFIISPNHKGGKLFSPPDMLIKLTEPLSPMQFHDLFLLSHPQIHTLSIGAKRVGDFCEHLDILEHIFNGKYIEQINGKIKKTMEDALGRRWYHQYNKGLPKYYQTPGQINIPMILRLYNLSEGLNMINFAKERYNMLGNSEHWVPGNNAANIGDYDLTECLKDSPFGKIIPGILQEAHNKLKGSPRYPMILPV